MTDDLRSVDAWWRAANYLSVAQIYLLGDPLLRLPLTPASIKPRLLGHWGTSPALNFVWAHLNRMILTRDVDMIFVCGPGHGGPAMVANAWLDSTYSELFPAVSRDEPGMTRLVRQFSFPGGIPSHAAPETPGSINEGGELGYSLAHAFGAVLDNPHLVAACVIGDGEAETGALAASWHANKLLSPTTDGTVLPILNLNGYKIANPTVLARIPENQLDSLFRGYGYHPVIVRGGFNGEDSAAAHRRMAEALDDCFDRIRSIRALARNGQSDEVPAWPLIVLRTPKGWTGPEEVDGAAVENTWRSHQVPLAGVRENADHLRQLESWLSSYRPEELFDADGMPTELVGRLAPKGGRRMSANHNANGGVRSALSLRDVRSRAVDTFGRRNTQASPMTVLGTWLADVIEDNRHRFRIFGPDETESNRLGAVLTETDRQWTAQILPTDEHLAPSGQMIELLSEQLLEGMLEGYLLSGRHGLMNSYEAFIHIVDSMFNQHAKWLESAAGVSWRKPIAPLIYVLSSHVWQQDHNGFSHQDPGFLNLVTNKQASLVRIYLPPDANSLLAVVSHALTSRDQVDVIVAGKETQTCWLSIDEAIDHLERGLSSWNWASTHLDRPPDVVIACAGDIPTREAVAAATILRDEFPELAVRLINVVDLMRLQDDRRHPHGMADDAFDALFTKDVPVIFAFHGYPSLIHQLTYRRTNHPNFHVRGFNEKGTTTTQFDMLMLNDLDRFRLAIDVLERVGKDHAHHDDLVRDLHARRAAARQYAYKHGKDPDDITAWKFTGRAS